MKALYLVKNKGTEVCRELQERDPHRISWEQRKIKEDAEKFRKIIQASRMRLGLEAL